MSIVTTMKCDCCGKEFYTEYYEDGYIDHVRNFSEQTDFLSKLTADKAILEIVTSGNKMRRSDGIKERLKCFCMQECVSESVKEECKRRIENYLKFDEEQRKIAKEKAEKLTDCEKQYLCDELMINYKPPIDYKSIDKALGYYD